MFANLLKSAFRNGSLIRRCLLGVVAGYALQQTPTIRMEALTKDIFDRMNVTEKQEIMNAMKQVAVASIMEVMEGIPKIIKVKDKFDAEHEILLIRFQNKIYAVGGVCPYRQKFFSDDNVCSFENASVFGDKLMCPHHGCAYHIKTGEVEHGPATRHIPKFAVNEKDGQVVLVLPAVIPKAVEPVLFRKTNNPQRAVILGGDSAATVGAINGFRHTGYTGYIDVVTEGPWQYPYHQEYLHRIIPNFRLHLPYRMYASKKYAKMQIKSKIDKVNRKISDLRREETKAQISRFPWDKKQSMEELERELQRLKELDASTPEPIKFDMDQTIKKLLKKDIYPMFNYYPEEYYQALGVRFTFVNDEFRIINKRRYPYIRFADDTRMDFDGMIIAKGGYPFIPEIEQLTKHSEFVEDRVLSENIFVSNYNKEQHTRLVTYLNKYNIKNILTIGLNAETLQFIDAIQLQFPDIKIKSIDTSLHTPLTQIYGKSIADSLLKAYVDKGHEFYMKIKDNLYFHNRLSPKMKEVLGVGDLVEQEGNRCLNSVSVELGSHTQFKKTIKADCVVIFPEKYIGDTASLKNSKYISFYMTKDGRIEADTCCRATGKRYFAVGLCGSMLYYLTNVPKYFRHVNTVYEQGYISAMNMMAIDVPLYYVPTQWRKFGDRRLCLVGIDLFYDQISIQGSVENWDFIAFYAYKDHIVRVVSTPSRVKQMELYRQAMRCNLLPTFSMTHEEDSIFDQLWNVLKMKNRSGCYKRYLRKYAENVHLNNIIWMNREHSGVGVDNDKPQHTQELPSQELTQTGEIRDL